MIKFPENKMPKPEYTTAVVIIAIIIISSLLTRSYDINMIRQLDHQAESEKMLVLSEYSANLIQNEWDAGKNSADKIISALQNHPQISNAFLTNDLAGVLSPKFRALEIVDDKNIEALLNNDDINVLSQIDGSELNVYRRINLNKDEKAILVINKLLISEVIKYFSLGFTLRLIVLAFIGVLASMLLSKLWQQPWKTLHEKFDQALQTGMNPTAIKSNNELVESHRILYRRYLLKVNSKR